MQWMHITNTTPTPNQATGWKLSSPVAPHKCTVSDGSGMYMHVIFSFLHVSSRLFHVRIILFCLSLLSDP